MKLKTKFWYESNAWFGWVNTLEDLKEVIKYQVKENNIIDTIDNFLDKSKRNILNTNNFGTRREHHGKMSLRTFLIKQNFNLKLLQ